MLFTYSAKSKEGQIIEGVIEAPNRFAALKELKSHDNMPTSITEKVPNAFDPMVIFERIFSRISVAELIILTKNLSGMIKAGLSLNRALSVLNKQSKNPTLIKVLNSISNDISSGETLSSALLKFPNVFSKLFVSMSKAGEESGNLAGALSDIGMNLEKSNSLTKKIKGALIYPGVILTAMIVIGVLMFAFVVPTLASTFKELGVTLPVTTRTIIWLGNFFSNNLVMTFVGITAIAFGIYSLFRSAFMAKYIDFVIIKLPVLGTMTKELNTARTARTLSSLLFAGVPITRAVEITEDVVQNVYYKKILSDTKISIEKGAPFAAIFEANTNLYPIMMSEMVQVGEETGKLSDMLLQIALFYEEEIENKTRNLSTIIEPVLMILIGAGVGFFAISMITPLYSVLNNIK